MPINKKGAPVRASRPSTGSSANAVRKSGSVSPKHRGYRPDAAPAPSDREPKKRWNADERAARGHSEQRPRGAAASNSARVGRERVERSADGRPNWEPKRAYDGRPTHDARPARDERGNRPARSFDDRPSRGSDARDDRPARSYDARPPRSYDNRPARDDRPARGYDRPADRAARPAKSWDRPQRDDRPARSYDRDARPARTSDDRPARSYDRDARPARSYDNDRPARSYGNDRPARSFDDRRPQRDDRPARSWSDRAPRQDAPRHEAPRHEAGPRPMVEDVVLERLTAQAVTAGEVDGIGFSDLGLGSNIVRVLAELGAATPFPIQAATIPDVLAGRDVLGRGRTGSGKTIAFGAPLVERLLALSAGADKGTRREFGRAPRALILAPTRELALQIDRTVQPIAQSVGLFTTQIYGGVPYARQLGALQRGVDIVIGTPGRVGDLAAQGKLDLSKTIITVLDEADHMCELGFAEPVQEILDRTAQGGQKLLFSATLDKGVADIVERYLVDPAVFEVSGEDQASSTIDHQVLLLDQRDKQQVLIELASGPGKKLVFARTRAFAEQLADLLDEAGIRAESIHGDLNQSRRTRALEKLTSGRVDVLVATDVAARGIHVDDIALVIQADAPDEYKAYLHRSGRTGRAGKEGTVVTLVPRNRRRRTEELLARAEIEANWTSVVPGDAFIEELAAR
ncbi:DEAD/DEAH box helicase [Lysinimonas soli]|uniref:DEAD/DEAH box helicase n=1 Tax=Lysinimonas soli TaxID=1074233 RepID=A0ABW0NQD9_9MICO